MSILRFVFCNYLKMSISILLFSVYFGSQRLNAEQFNATYSRNFKDYKEQSNLLSPIHFLTDREVINRKINKTFLDSGLESDLLTAKENLDKLQSNQWILTESQANFFQNLLNSRHLIRPHLVKYINNCKKLLKKWSLNNQQKLARYFFHAFHLLLNPPSYRAQKNILFNNSPPKSGDLAFGFLSFINQMYFQLDSTLKIYFYQLNQPEIIDSIQKLAYWIGPHRIKIILEEDYLHKDKLRGDPSDYSTALRKLLNAGIRIRTDKSYRSNGNGESHHKFAIIEPDQIFTGSWNPTSRGTNRNFNHAFWLQSKKLLKLYDHEFEQIWQGKSQSHKSSHWD
ncbi:MAG: phospholipase D-like domain-containing protein, partial [bacterium]|nr:phospholipase D-like domain-containing protein [bacterium]